LFEHQHWQIKIECPAGLARRGNKQQRIFIMAVARVVAEKEDIIKMLDKESFVTMNMLPNARKTISYMANIQGDVSLLEMTSSIAPIVGLPPHVIAQCNDKARQHTSMRATQHRLKAKLAARKAK